MTGLRFRTDPSRPAGARTIRVRQTFTRLSPAGPSNDGYSDNLVLTLAGL